MFSWLLMVLGACWGGEPGGEPCPIPREKGGAMGWPTLWVWDGVLLGSACWPLGRALRMPRVVLHCPCTAGHPQWKKRGSKHFLFS